MVKNSISYMLDLNFFLLPQRISYSIKFIMFLSLPQTSLVFQDSVMIIMLSLNFILIIFLSRINSWRKLYSKASLKMSSISFMCSMQTNRMSNLLSNTHGWAILLPIFSSMLSFLVTSLFTLIILSYVLLVNMEKKSQISIFTFWIQSL